ncbi:MAG: PQQ-binding-like beta-propeller repeat protein [Novosphingobium sp.]|uniref:outer membrane protein assembly factor BamB family protein n=1 Tax=Novosphingobium sp. TaxID=1874826 RepID=UPI001D744A97|nr:PQQ-binding-like beta-propeller repeat protein [Novosphingobium sp.]MCB2056908.1 PQQ-binding-like beta-propeller repeat protein [Novosphingobium sp.]MCP5385511.1 PQQ-binding-like beta-propeller repeat protein [Novosphingobium sp.]HNJ47085.1 PQQ-binding-like beta-propeller repeat protein [Novosphingobium sp.]HNN56065.1 PQQ-binding-like beta-propeller repeat protein [Novosphingobium sp.]
MLAKTLSRRSTASLALVLAVALSGCGVFGGKDKPKTPTVGNRVPILSRVESGAKVDPALADVAVIVPPATANADWPQAGGTANKAYGNLAIGASPRRDWSVRIVGSNKRQRLAASPVIGGGQMFVMDTDGMVHAFDAAKGTPNWTRSFMIKGDGATSVFGGGASYADGRVYVTTGVGEVASLDAQTGAVKWKVKPAGPLRGSPTIAFNTIFVMTQDNQILGLDAGDGSVLWSENAATGQSGVFGVGAPAAGQGTVIAGFSTGELVAYRYENGRQLWTDALARTSLSTTVGVLTDIDADPIIDRGRVFALGQGGRMAAYELVTGQRIWELNLAGISTPAVAGDWIFTLTDDAKLLCMARANGKVRWLTQLPRFRNEQKKKDQIFWSGPVLAGERLWFTNSRGEVYSASVTDGRPQLVDSLGSPITLAPVVAGGRLYVLDDGGDITVYR